MSRYIPKETLQEILSRADIIDVVSKYLQLKKVGGRWKGLCPFHNEKTPSFIVNEDTQSYHCFGCGKGGNILSFLMEKENIDFLEAAHYLADRFNVIIPETQSEYQGGSSSTPQNYNFKDKALKLHELATNFYSKKLYDLSQSAGLDYFKNRKIPDDIIKKFKLGFAPESWDFLKKTAKTYNYTDAELIESGLCVKKDGSDSVYDRFRNRVMFPIWDPMGRVVGFSGRVIDNNSKAGKYVNSPETIIFKKSRILYALPLAKDGFKEHNFAILCEGQLDVIAMHRAGYTNSVAPQGTAFTEEQARLLKRYVDEVYICFDGDGAGVKASIKAIDILFAADVKSKVISLEEGSDPDTIFMNNGTEGVKKFVDSAKDFYHFLFEKYSKTFDINTPEGKSSVAIEILNTISQSKNEIKQASYVSLLAKDLSIPEAAVKTELTKLINQAKERAPRPQEQPAKEIPVQQESAVKIVYPRLVLKAEKELLELAIKHGTVAKQIEDSLPPEYISKTRIGEALNLVLAYHINGEWEKAKDAIKEFNEGNDKELSALLAAPTEYSLNFNHNEATTDCINTIKKNYIEQAIREKLARMKSTEGLAKIELVKEIAALQKEKFKLKR